MMSRRPWEVLILSLILLTLCIGCGSQEKEAREKLVQTRLMLRKGDLAEIKAHLEKIIAEYPETEAASGAAKMLDEMVARANGIAETALRGALAAAVGYLAGHPDQDLSMARLRAFGFRDIKGVKIDIERPEADDFVITSRHVAGDRLYWAGNDGQVEYEESKNE